VTVAGKFGGFLQVDADDARLMTSQVSVLTPPQMSSLEKPLNKIKIFKVRLSKVNSSWVMLVKVRLG
jgi:hypothetical protein